MQTKTPIEELAERFGASKDPLVTCSARIPLWLNEALEQQVARLRGKRILITKSAVITEALKQFLGVSAPKGADASNHPGPTGDDLLITQR